MSWTDFGSTFEERKANPAYREAMEEHGRRTGVTGEGDVRPLLYPYCGNRTEILFRGKWVLSKEPMPLTRTEKVA